MLESSPVSFFFNQGEYEADVITNLDGYLYRLSDDEETVLKISLTDDGGIKKIETVNMSEVTASNMICAAIRIEGSRIWRSVKIPPCPLHFEIKLKGGRITVAYPRPMAQSSLEWDWIEHRMGKDGIIPRDMVVGWREKKN